MNDSFRKAAYALMDLPLSERGGAFDQLLDRTLQSDFADVMTANQVEAMVPNAREIMRIAAEIGVIPGDGDT